MLPIGRVVVNKHLENELLRLHESCRGGKAVMSQSIG